MHARKVEQRRGSAHARGYTRHWREVFIPLFVRLLIAAGIRQPDLWGHGATVCGAALPDGPAMTESRCKADGRLTFTNMDGSSLHLHHSPPLLDEERDNRRAVEDPTRVGFLCATCHGAETNADQRGASA